jgi:hypothetical protein
MDDHSAKNIALCHKIADLCQNVINWFIMKKYLEKNEIATLFFLHYFKYTRYAFKKHKTDEDKASINAHRTLMRMFGAWHQEGRVLAEHVIAKLKIYIVSSESPYVQRVSDVMRESVSFLYDHVLQEEHRLLERYA